MILYPYTQIHVLPLPLLSLSLSLSLSESKAGDKEASAMSSRGGGGDLHLRELLMEKTGEVHKLKAELDKYVNLLITPPLLRDYIIIICTALHRVLEY